VVAGHQGDAGTARAALNDSNPVVRAAALGALDRCDELDAAQLAAGLGDPDRSVRRRAALIAAHRDDVARGNGARLDLDRIDDTTGEEGTSGLGGVGRLHRSRARDALHRRTAMHADRVRHIAPADYRPGSHLRLLLEEMVTEIADNIIERRRNDLEAATVRAPKH
jgi:hypothetical protein